jgi:hypothetical protein
LRRRSANGSGNGAPLESFTTSTIDARYIAAS